MQEIDYLSLAKQAKAEGNMKLVMMYAKNFARVYKKKMSNEKGAAVTAPIR